MSEKEIINDEMIFQSFSKNLILDSTKKQNEISDNENIEFTFKKNLFSQKSEESSKKNLNKNNYNNMPSFDKDMNIYSKNDINIQESGHFGKSKYDSNKYKNIIQENKVIRQPLFNFDENFGKIKKNNLNMKNIELQESKLFNNRIKKAEIKKVKSGIKLNSMNNINKSINLNKENYSKSRNQNQIKKMDKKNKSIFYSKGTDLFKNENNKNFKNNGNDDLDFLNRKTFCEKENNLLLNRIKNKKENDFRSYISNTFYMSNNNRENFYFIDNDIRPSNNKNTHRITQVNDYNNKISKIPTGKINNIKPKFKKSQREILKNSKIFSENKENISINISNNTNNNFYNYQLKNNTINNFNHNQNITYINEMKYNNLHKDQPNNKNSRMNKYIDKHDKKDNLSITTNNLSKKVSEIKFFPINNNSILLSSVSNTRNSSKNGNPRTNRNKCNNQLYSNKLNTITINKSFGIKKPQIHKSTNDTRKKNISKINTFNKLFGKNDFFYF